MFKTVKDVDGQRVVIYSRSDNLVFKERPHLDLPNPGLITEPYLDGCPTFFVAESDIDNYYQRFIMQHCMSDYRGLSPINMEPETIWPAVRSLPMGLAHSVFVYEMVYENSWSKQTYSLSEKSVRREIILMLGIQIRSVH